jgi:hypothetical protein
MNVLFVMRTAGYFPYHQSTIEHLLRRGHRVSLLFAHDSGPVDERGFHEWLADGRDVTMGPALKREGIWRRILFATREARSYASYCRRGPDVTVYRERWRQYLPAPLRRASEHSRLARAVFRAGTTEHLLAAVERVAPASGPILTALRRDRPDCVVVSPVNLRFDEEVEYVKAARRAGIPSVVPVQSWDNLTTKGLFHVHPDLVLAWHHGHREEAESIHRIPADRIVITGAPFFDKWFAPDRTLGSRAATCARLGLNEAWPYVLYLGSSANIARDESWLVTALVQALRQADQPALRTLQVAFKPHPANLRPLPGLDAAGVPVCQRERGRPDTPDAVAAFRDALHHAAAVVGVNTTGMLDAVLCDRPCVALAVKRYRDTQTRTAHFQRMQASKALLVAGSVNVAVEMLGRIVGGEDRTETARRHFAETYARPRGLGMAAGQAAATAIELASQRLTGRAIDAAIDAERAATTRAERAIGRRVGVDATT